MASSSRPSVSVILASLNEANYVEETINSILGQSYSNLEVHIQDAGSTDGTLEILRTLPVRVVVEKDSGVPDAFNRGIRATSGEIVIVLGADDPMTPGSIDLQVDTLLQRPKAGWVYGDCHIIDASGHAYQYVRGRPYDLDDLFWRNYVATQSVAMRRTALVDVGMYREGNLIADWDLWLRLGARYPSVYIPRALASWRVHDGSTGLNNLKHYAWSTKWVVETLLADPDIVARLRRGKARAFAGGILNAATTYVVAGEMQEARRLYLQAVRAYPPAVFRATGAKATLAFLLGPKLYYRVRHRGRRSDPGKENPRT